MSDVRADIPAERLVLGAALNGHAVAPLAAILNAEDFYQPRHEAIWRAIQRVTDAGQPVDVSSVRLALDHQGAPVDPLYLAELYGEASLTADGTFHAERVAEEARFRRLATASIRIGQVAASRELTYADAFDVARSSLTQAASSAREAGLSRIGDVLPDVLDIAEKGQSPALSTPWPDVDRFLTGLAPGRLVVVGARPGVGKSIMGTNLALHFATKHSHAVLVASMEMPREEVTQRLVAAHAKVNLTKLVTGATDEASWAKIHDHFAAINSMPIWIDDAAGQSVGSMRSAAKEIQSERPDLALIVVDYLQLMQAPEAPRGASRSERIGEMSRGLKMLARETGACVVAMAQVNREGVKNGGRPTMADLRESGAIEADADQVVLLHWPDEQVPEIEVIVDKNRWGPKGTAHLQMIGHYARLGSVTRAWSPSSALGPTA